MFRIFLPRASKRGGVTHKVLAALALLLASFAGNLPAQEPTKTANAQEKKFMHEVSGEFDVKLVPVDTGDEKVGMMTIDKQYHGDLAGTGKGRMLASMSDVKGSGVYVAIERVSAKLKGAEGTFVLHHTGIMDKGAQSLSIRVVPDSGTGDLTGIEGEMQIIIENKKHFYRFAYTLVNKK